MGDLSVAEKSYERFLHFAAVIALKGEERGFADLSVIPKGLWEPWGATGSLSLNEPLLKI